MTNCCESKDAGIGAAVVIVGISVLAYVYMSIILTILLIALAAVAVSFGVAALTVLSLQRFVVVRRASARMVDRPSWTAEVIGGKDGYARKALEAGGTGSYSARASTQAEIEGVPGWPVSAPHSGPEPVRLRDRVRGPIIEAHQDWRD